MHVIGIDPGLTGAIAVLAPDGTLERLADLPVIRDGRLAWIDGCGLQSLLSSSIASTVGLLERSSSVSVRCRGKVLHLRSRSA
jgi:hypothetical protein